MLWFFPCLAAWLWLSAPLHTVYHRKQPDCDRPANKFQAVPADPKDCVFGSNRKAANQKTV